MVAETAEAYIENKSELTNPHGLQKAHFKKKTLFPLRKDEETISEVGMVDWISKCEFIAGGRIAQ